MKHIVTALTIMFLIMAVWLCYQRSNAPLSRATVVPRHATFERLENRQHFEPAPKQARQLQQQQEANQKHLSVFLADGWKVVQRPPYDPRVVGLDPKLLADNEPALRSQLQSTRVGEALLENAVTIALEANEHLTRAAAINAIGHSSAPDRDSALMELFDSLTDERERSQALGFLLPLGVESREGRWLIDKLSDRDIPLSLKQQIPTKLVLSGLHGSRGKVDFVDPLLNAVPDQWKDEIVAVSRMYDGVNSLYANADD